MIRLLAILLLLSGCTTIDKQIAGWPILSVQYHELGFWEVQSKCWEHIPTMYKLLGGVAMACAEVNFDAGTCDIYHLRNPSKTDIEHELSHCRGGDHGGVLQKYFDMKKRG